MLGIMDKIVIISGGSTGVGRATAITFAEIGARVVIADVNSDSGKGVIGQIESRGQKAVFVEADISVASEGASFMTGNYVCVDGGLTAKGSWND